MGKENFNLMSIGKPIHWAAESNKIPNQIDFASQIEYQQPAKKNLDLSLSYSSIIIILVILIISSQKLTTFCNKWRGRL